MRRPPPTRPLLVVVCLLTAVLTTLTTALPARAAAAGGPEPGGGWVWPLQPPPAVVATFDAPEDPYGRGHRGVDLAGAVGQQVLAVAAGEVTFAGPVAGRGVVVVEHGRLRTTYQPVTPLVRRGDVVAGGQAVATLGLLGSHCLPVACLHLGVRDDDVYLDPLRFLDTGPIRLLPPPPFGWAPTTPLLMPFAPPAAMTPPGTNRS